MKNKKSSITLAAKVMGGITFMFVFVLNTMLFVQKDELSGDIALESLEAYAQHGGEVNGRQYYLDHDLESDIIIDWGDSRSCLSCCPEMGHFCYLDMQTCGPEDNGDC